VHRQSLEIQKSQMLDSVDRQKYKRVMISRSFLARGYGIEHIVAYFKMAKIVKNKYSREILNVPLNVKAHYIAG